MAETSRTLQLKSLTASLPGANQQVQQGLDEARKTQLQNTIKNSQPAQATTANAQQLGAQQQAVAGQNALQAQQTTQNQLTSVGQLGLQEAGLQQRQEDADQAIRLNDLQQKAANKLSQLDSSLKNELLDRQLQFQKDKAGNTLFTERQLMDYAASKAQSEEEFANYAQMADQAYSRKIQVLEVAHKKLLQTAEQGYISEGKALDQESKKQIVEKMAAVNGAIDRAKNRQAENKARNQATGTIVGTAIGGAIGSVIPGAGTMAGMAIGGALGGAIGGMF